MAGFADPNNNYAGTFTYSAVKIDDLQASEYTLAAVVVDQSASVGGFVGPLEDSLKEIVRACRHSPRADNLLLRLSAFNSTVVERHGFKPLASCHDADYQGAVQPGGMTALHDAIYDGLLAVSGQAKALVDQDFQTNAILVVITDGDENCSKTTLSQVQDQVAALIRSEVVESITTILIGVNASQYSATLATLSKNLKFTQFVDVGSASAANLAKLAEFVSKSIVSQSQALSTGSASALLSF